MFRRLHERPTSPVEITIDGRRAIVDGNDSVAAALFAAGHLACRVTPVSGAARGPYCMMGVCFDCLVTIDGVPNQQACLTNVRQGMNVESQRGARPIGR